jgi:hypothetical protein
MSQMIYAFLPGCAPLALGTMDALGFPINQEARRGKSLALPRLPVGVGSDRADDLHAMHRGSRNVDACIDIARIHQMLGWEQIARGQVSVDGVQ